MPLDKKYASYRSLSAPKVTKQYSIMEIQNLDHRRKLITENSIICIYLHGSWCEPCKEFRPLFGELAEQYNNKGKCLLVAEDVDLELTRDFQITGIPAFIFYKNGHIIRETTNGVPISVIGSDMKKIQSILDQLLGLQ